MYFLSWKDDVWDILTHLLESLARNLFFFIDRFIYDAIRYVYNIFLALCNGRILDNDSIMALFSRIGVILGVVMLFVVSFSVIQLLVNPDAINDAEKGIQNIVKKVIFVIVMLGVSGYVFNILAEVQAIVIERDIIPRLLLTKAVSTENVGGNLSAELFMIFYQVGVEPENSECGETYRDETKAAIADGDWERAGDCLTEGDGEDKKFVFFMNFNWLFSLLFGIGALYLIFSYCVSAGVRLIQLTFLQIISPAAIIGYLSPKKDNVFSKWVKIYFSTYIDVFIRIAIINFAMYLIALLMDGWENQTTGFWASVGSPGIGTKGFIAAIMILAILSFAKKAPELLKQLLPQGASGLGYGIDEYAKKGAGLGLGVGAALGLAGAGKAKGFLAKKTEGFRNQQGIGNKLGYIANGIHDGVFNTGRKMQSAGRTAIQTGNNFKNADMSTKGKMLWNGTKTGLKYGWHGIKSGAKIGTGAVSGLSSVAYKGGKAGSGAKNPISAAYEGGKTASYGTVSNNRLAAYEYLDGIIDKDKGVKAAKAMREKAMQDGTYSGQNKDYLDGLVETAQKDAWDNSSMVKAAADGVAKQTGMKFSKYKDFDTAYTKERERQARRWKPSK